MQYTAKYIIPNGFMETLRGEPKPESYFSLRSYRHEFKRVSWQFADLINRLEARGELETWISKQDEKKGKY